MATLTDQESKDSLQRVLNKVNQMNHNSKLMKQHGPDSATVAHLGLLVVYAKEEVTVFKKKLEDMEGCDTEKKRSKALDAIQSSQRQFDACFFEHFIEAYGLLLHSQVEPLLEEKNRLCRKLSVGEITVKSPSIRIRNAEMEIENLRKIADNPVDNAGETLLDYGEFVKQLALAREALNFMGPKRVASEGSSPNPEPSTRRSFPFLSKRKVKTSTDLEIEIIKKKLKFNK